MIGFHPGIVRAPMAATFKGGIAALPLRRNRCALIQMPSSPDRSNCLKI
jgi:hypothetical protein